MAKRFGCFILTLLPVIAAAQIQSITDYKFISSFPCESRVFSTDRLSNAYVVKSKNKLVKIQPSGESTYNFELLKYGKIGQLDCSNTLNLLVFFPDYVSIVILDNTLSVQSELSLYNIGINQVSTMCLAYDNNIWVYDQVLLKLLKISQSMKIVAESEDFSSIFPYEVHPNFMLEQDNQIFLNDPEIGILVFDFYGTYKKTIPIKGLESFQYIKKQILYFKEQRFYSYDLATLKSREIPLPAYPEDLKNVRMEKERLYLLRKEKLDIYSFN